MKSRDAEAWFEQPLVWLGAAILLASVAACIVAIVLAMRHADTPVETGSGNVLNVPLRHSAATLQHAQERR